MPDRGLPAHQAIDHRILICELRRARTSLVRAYALHVSWLVIMCTSAALHWHQTGVGASVLLTLATVPPVLFYTVRVHHLCRSIDPAAPTVGWIPVLVTTFVLSPFESGLILPAKNLLAAGRILRTHQTSITASPAVEAVPDQSSGRTRERPRTA